MRVLDAFAEWATKPPCILSLEERLIYKSGFKDGYTQAMEDVILLGLVPEDMRKTIEAELK